MLRQLEIRLFDVEAQLFILQCLLEMQSDKIIYEGSIMSFEAILMHQNYQSGDSAQFELFRKLLHEVNKQETLRDHNFMKNSSPEENVTSLLLSKDQQVSSSLEMPFVPSSSLAIGVENSTSGAAVISSNKIIGGTLRQNSLGFTLFLLTLAQANHEVQFQVLEDLCILAEQSLRNVRVMVQQNIQVYLLQMLKSERDSGGFVTRLGVSPSRYLINLLQILLSYGVCVPRHTNHQDLLVECLGYKRKLNNLFVDSVIECLSSSFSQISGYVHFMDKKVGQNALKIDGGAIGLSLWLLTPEVSPEASSKIQLDRPKKAAKLQTRAKITEKADSIDPDQIRDFEGASLSSYDINDELSPGNFKLRISLTSRKPPVTQVFRLEDMINLSVFHLHGFNHYVMQFGAFGGFDLFINGHRLASAIFLEQLSSNNRNIILKSLDFDELMTVANLSLIHTAVNNSVKEIEQLRDQDFTVKQNELMGLTQLKSVSQNNFYVNFLNKGSISSNNQIITDHQKSHQNKNGDEDEIFTLFIPELDNSLEMIQHKKVQMTIERHMIDIPVLSEDSTAIEVFHDSESIMTLKRYLSTDHALIAILDLLEATVDDDSTFKCIRLLASILIQNKQAIAESVNLNHQRLTNILAQKLPEMHHSSTRAVFTQLIEIACDELNCSLRIDETIISQSSIIEIRQPTLYQSRISFLQIGLDLIEYAPVDQSIQFLEMVQTLLKVDENLFVFRKHIGIDAIFSLFRLIEQNYKFLSLYDNALALFELFIGGISRHYTDSLSEEEKQEMKMIFDFILSRDLECRLKFIKVSQQLSSKPDVSIASFQNLLLNSQKQNELVARVIIDCLSIISIHILTENPIRLI